jgi:hypothetical protein
MLVKIKEKSMLKMNNLDFFEYKALFISFISLVFAYANINDVFTTFVLAFSIVYTGFKIDEAYAKRKARIKEEERIEKEEKEKDCINIIKSKENDNNDNA